MKIPDRDIGIDLSLLVYIGSILYNPSHNRLYQSIPKSMSKISLDHQSVHPAEKNYNSKSQLESQRDRIGQFCTVA
jgi:hypothetical protein